MSHPRKKSELCLCLSCFYQSLHLLCQNSDVTNSICRVLTELVSKMKDMQMDKTELGCLRAIVLFNPGQFSLLLFSRYCDLWTYFHVIIAIHGMTLSLCFRRKRSFQPIGGRGAEGKSLRLFGVVHQAEIPRPARQVGRRS